MQILILPIFIVIIFGLSAQQAFADNTVTVKIFCKTHCTTMAEQKDVYRSLLLRSMFSEDETIKRSKLTSLTSDEARAAIKLYRLSPKPIDVIQGK